MLELKNVTHEFSAGKRVLQQVSMKIGNGEFVAVVGRSGAGKTTLLKLFNGMVVPKRGTVWVEGECLSQCGGSKLRQLQQKIAVIYQDFCLVSELTVLENVLQGGLYRNSIWRVMTGCFPTRETVRAKEALEKVGLADKADMLVSVLSGGEKQRVAIARALQQRARIILADEPVASLDPATAEQILILLKSLQKENGLTLVMNSHNTEQAIQYARRIIGLRQGTIVKDAPTAQWDEAAFSAVYGVAQ